MREIALMLRFLALLVPLAGVLAQPPDTVWTRMLGSDGNDYATDIEPLGDDRFAVSGVFGALNASPAGYLVMFDSDGDTLWTRVLADSQVMDVASVEPLVGRGIAFTGSSVRNDHGIKIVVGRISVSGQLEWLRYYDELDALTAWDIVSCSDGGLVVVGGTPFASSAADALVFKVDSVGGLVWSRAFGGPHAEHFESVVRTCDGGYLAAGYGQYPDDPNESRFYLAKVSDAGDSLWSAFVGEGPRSWAHAVCTTPDCGFLVVGNHRTQEMPEQISLVRIDSAGNEIWSREYGGGEDDKCYDVCPLSEGGYFLCGSTRSFGAGSTDIFLLRIDESGDTLWTRTFGSELIEWPTSVAASTGDGYFVAGAMQRQSTWDMDVLVMRLQQSQWSENHSNRHNTISVCRNYPNPFNSVTTLDFVLSVPSRVSIRAYDMLGRDVGTISDAFYASGRHTIMWQCPTCASGTYWISMTGYGFQLVRKAVLLR